MVGPFYRRTLNGREPRSFADSCRDPYDWISGPHKQHITRFDKVLGGVTAIGIGIAAAVLLWLEAAR